MDPVEVELKLAIAAESIAALRASPLLARARRMGSATLHNTYFDTPKLNLWRRAVGLRVRRFGRRELQTVKCTGVVAAGLSARNEWEQSYAGTFDFAAVGDAALRKRLERHRAELAPVFATRFRRERWIVRPAPGCEIELALDRGEITAGTTVAPVCEIELELLRGSRAQLLAFAQSLAGAVPLLPDSRSKAERGYALHQGQPLARPLRAARIELDGGLAPIDAFCRIAWSCIDQIAVNMLGACTGEDPEFVHQMRVGARRLRSALRLFGPLLPQDAAQAMQSALRALAQLAAPARAWDVLIHDIIEPAARQAPGHAGLRSLIDAARQRRDAQRDAMRTALRGAGPGALLLSLMRELDRLAGAAQPAAQPGLGDFAAARVSRLGRRVARAAAAASDGDPARLHALRLALKRLRYSLEFVGALLRARHGVRTGALAPLQGSLGLINDLYVCGPLIESLAQDRPELLPAVALVGGHHLAAWHALTGAAAGHALDLKKLARGWAARS